MSEFKEISEDELYSITDSLGNVPMSDWLVAKIAEYHAEIDRLKEAGMRPITDEEATVMGCNNCYFSPTRCNNECLESHVITDPITGKKQVMLLLGEVTEHKDCIYFGEQALGGYHLCNEPNKKKLIGIPEHPPACYFRIHETCPDFKQSERSLK